MYGYQLKEGKAKTSQLVDEAFNKSFVIKGLPSNDSIKTDAAGWSIPSKEVIDTFFGVSGKHWTPQAWARLTQQVDEMELDKEPSSDPVRLNELINTAGVRAITGERNQKLQSKNVPQEAA